MLRPRVLLLEFNELTPLLMNRFIKAGWLPNFERLSRESHIFVTDAQESPEHLEPWIQWVTVHTGLSYKDHGVFHLNEGSKLDLPSIWDIASRAGVPAWICGSMNVKFETPFNGWVLPDPWSSGDAYPPALNAFRHFVSKQVQEHSNESAPLSYRDALRFLGFLMSHGLTLDTVTAVVKQLIAERTANCRWKRAALLDRMQWDVFRHHWRRARPGLSTFFLNSTAHFQHCYWRNMEPEAFKLRPSDADQEQLKDAILFGYRQMDRIVGQAIELAADDTVLILATALGQQPYLIAEDSGGKQLYRPHDLANVPEMFGLTGVSEVVPVMAEQFYIYHRSAHDASRSFEILKQAHTNGARIFGDHCLEVKDSRIFLGCSIRTEVPKDAAIHLASGAEIPFYGAFYLIKDSLKSGMHHPDGILWLRTLDRQHTEAEGKVPLTSLAPTILQLMDLEIPNFMRTAPLALGKRTSVSA